MKMANRILFTTSLFGFVLVLSTSPLYGDRGISVEKLPQAVDVSITLPPEMLKGANFTVEKTAENNGFFNTYTMHNSTGQVRVESAALLRVRVQEQNALGDMQKMKKSDTFVEGLKKSALAPVNTVEGLLTEPGETLSNIGSGMSNWFSDVSRAITSDDPHQDNALKTAVGYSATKRKYAYEFDIDPYTSNKVVQDELSKVSQAAFAGGIIPKVAFSSIDGGVGTALRLTGTADSMKKLVRDKSPAELEEINSEKLRKMGVPDYLIKGFLTSRHYTPYDETLLVGELEAMGNVAGREKIIAEAAMADSSDVAFYLRMKTHMMALYNGKIAKFEKFEQLDGRTAVGVKTDGTVVLLTLADYVPSSTLLWAKEQKVSQAIEQLNGAKGKELWISGTFAPTSRELLQDKGWTLVENAWAELK